MPTDLQLSAVSDSVFWPLLGLTAFAFSTSYLMTAVAKRVAPRLGLVDHPDGRRKLHRHATPVMGGVAIYCALLLTVLIARLIDFNHDVFLSRGDRTIWGLLISAGLFCILGLYDDKKSIRPRYKLIGQVVASLPFAVVVQSIESVHFLGIEVDLGIWGFVGTLFWLVTCANVVNLFDGLDGLATVIGLTATMSVAVLCLIGDQFGLAVCSLICTASIAGFLPHNWPPAKIFLGDSGSLTIGFLAGALSIQGSFKSATGLMLVVPVVCMSVPIFDTMLAILRRKLRGRKISDPDREHIHHRLQDRGMTSRQVLLTIGFLCFLMATSSIASVYFDNDWIAAGVCFSLLAMVTAKGYFGDQEVHLIRQQWQVVRNVVRDAGCLLRLRIRLNDVTASGPDNWQQLWDETCRLLSNSGGYTLTVYLDQADDNQNCVIAEWKTEGRESPSDASDAIQYSRRLDGDTVITLIAQGNGLARMSNTVALFESFDSLCRQLPVEMKLEVESKRLKPYRKAA